MLVGVVKTDGGPHSAEKLAVVTAGQIIQIGADASGKDALEARKLENKIIDVLEEHHSKCHEWERGMLKDDPEHHKNPEFDSSDEAELALVDVVKEAKGSMFETHFDRPEVQEHIRGVLHNWFNTSKHIERDWHSKR